MVKEYKFNCRRFENLLASGGYVELAYELDKIITRHKRRIESNFRKEVSKITVHYFPEEHENDEVFYGSLDPLFEQVEKMLYDVLYEISAVYDGERDYV